MTIPSKKRLDSFILEPFEATNGNQTYELCKKKRESGDKATLVYALAFARHAEAIKQYRKTSENRRKPKLFENVFTVELWFLHKSDMKKPKWICCPFHL